VSQFKPVHNAHAIESVLTGIQFSRALDDSGLKEVREMAMAFKDDLPRQVEIQGMMLSFGPPGAVPTPTSEGFVLQNIERDGSISSELRIEPASITYRTDTYMRWDGMWSTAKKYYEATSINSLFQV